MDAYVLSKEQYLTYARGLRAAVRSCMAKFGFADFRALDSAVDQSYPGMKADKAHYFFIIDVDRAARFGYGSARDGEREETPEEGVDGAGGETDDSPTAAENAVFQGKNAGTRIGGVVVPKGGCAAEGAKALRAGGGVEGVEIVTVANERNDAYQRALEDDRVRKVFAKWSTCMKKSGYRYATPLEPGKDRRWREEIPSRAQITVAKADVACKQRTNTVGVWWAVVAAYEKKYIDEHAEHLADVKKTIDATMRNSARLVARGQ
ncbi:hypothetical protein [Streptomyces lasiicapitis]|nr:hypothetical protein [Streptomyces lasiicapitis]